MMAAFIPASILILVASTSLPGGVKPWSAKIMPDPKSGSVVPTTILAKNYFDAKRQLDLQCHSPCRIIEDVREER